MEMNIKKGRNGGKNLREVKHRTFADDLDDLDRTRSVPGLRVLAYTPLDDGVCNLPLFRKRVGNRNRSS